MCIRKRRKNPTTPEQAIKETARHFGVSEEEVRGELERSIRMAFLSGSAEERARLGAIPSAGEMLTPEELVAYLLEKRDEKGLE